MKEEIEIHITSPEDVYNATSAAVSADNDNVDDGVVSVVSTAATSANNTASSSSSALTIDFQSFPGKKIQSKDLAKLIGNEYYRLEHFGCDGVRVVGDFSIVLQALSTCHKLKSFDIFSSQLITTSEETTNDDQEEDPTTTTTSQAVELWNNLGRTLAEIPTCPLVHLSIGFSTSTSLATQQQQTPWSIVTPILQNPNHALRILFLNGFNAPPSPSTATVATNDDNNNNNSNSNNIDDLLLLQVQEENNKVGEFFMACAASKTLQQFTCLPFSSHSFANVPTVTDSIEQMIRQTSSIQLVKISLDPNVRLEGIANALRYNRSIRKLDIQGGGGGGGGERRRRVEQQQQQRGRRQRRGRGRSTSSSSLYDIAALETFRSSLEYHNFTLKELHLRNIMLVLGRGGGGGGGKPSRGRGGSSCSSSSSNMKSIMKGIDFYLKLNRNGREGLLSLSSSTTTTKEDPNWMIDTIASFNSSDGDDDNNDDNDNLSATFYFLRELNSLLFLKNHVTTAASSTTTTDNNNNPTKPYKKKQEGKVKKEGYDNKQTTTSICSSSSSSLECCSSSRSSSSNFKKQRCSSNDATTFSNNNNNNNNNNPINYYRPKQTPHSHTRGSR